MPGLRDRAVDTLEAAPVGELHHEVAAWQDRGSRGESSIHGTQPTRRAARALWRSQMDSPATRNHSQPTSKHMRVTRSASMANSMAFVQV